MTQTLPDPADYQTSAADRRTAAEVADGLRHVARFIEDNPHLVDAAGLDWRFSRILIPTYSKDDTAALARAGARCPDARVNKHQGDKYAGVNITFNDRVSLHVYVDREVVCEKVVTGTREVTEEVPDPQALAAVPKVAVTKVVEDVQWVCTPLLAEAGADR